MFSSRFLLPLVTTFSLWTSVNAATDMGPAAFMWPPDREWGAAQDNTPPCGSSAGVTQRTKFPLVNGAVALVLQDESYDVNLAIAYEDDPQTNTAFSTLIPSTAVHELNPGHECYAVPNPPPNTNAGSNATLQLKYTAQFDNPQNETFYACADITFVEAKDFSTNIPCFNVSVEDPGAGTTSSVGSGAGATSTAAVGGKGSGGGNGGISKGAIAGAVVGGVLGALALGVVGWVLLRRYRQKVKRERAVALRMNELTNPTKSSASSEH